MQATQSSTALGFVGSLGQFAALRHITREMDLHPDFHAEIGAQRSIAVECHDGYAGVSEGAGLAHDAGNLLGALRLYSDLLGMPGVLHEEHREYAAELKMLSDRSWAMIDRLVNHAGAGRRVKKAAETVVLPDIVDRCRGLLGKIAGRAIETSYGLGAFQPVNVPVESVERILTNLVKNAAEASSWVGAITIHVEGVRERDEVSGEERRRVSVTVRDKGCGIDEAGVQRLMEGTGASREKGRGLGFRVVRELVAISGGCLSIESEPEVGTSISAEWYAVTESEGVGQRASAGWISTEEKIKTVLKGDAGWIAC
jgi:C4-dicarboxylate-specific signal transduction histidine kinase